MLLDLSAAFDTVAHHRLLQRLTEIGIVGSAFQWFSSFLVQSTQTVNLGNFHSEAKSLNKGVPQGSCLIATLFNIYMAPLAKNIRDLNFVPFSYADDTQLLFSFDNNSDDTKQKFAEGMREISNWMSKNFLQLNANKTEVFLFGRAQLLWSPEWWPTELDPAPVPTNKAKNVGVYLDLSLAMKEQVAAVSGSCFGLLKFLLRVFDILPLSARKTLLQALVVSRLDYCNALLGAANEGTMNRLQVVQSMAARLALNQPPRTHSLPLLKSLHWLPIRSRIKFKICCLIHKTLNNSGPRYMTDSLTPHLPNRQLRSSGKALLVVLRVNKFRTGGKAFAYVDPRLWNKLPLALLVYPDLSKFRKLLKTELF